MFTDVMRVWRPGDKSVSSARALRQRVGRRALAPAVVLLALAGAAPSLAAGGPVNSLPPEVIGNPLVGERLVCYPGSWTGIVGEFKFAWVRDGILFATGGYHQITAADEGHELWCVVTAVDSEGTTEKESVNSVVVGHPKPPTPPVPGTPPPEISGEPVIGRTLSCSNGTWTGSVPMTFAFQWLREESGVKTNIPGATVSTYELAAKDAGSSVLCRVTATNSAGSEAAYSKSVRIKGEPPKPKTLPQVFGSEPAAVGESLTCWPGTWSEAPPPSFTYQWLRDGIAIEPATGSTYTVSPADQLQSLRCRVTAANSEGSTEALSSNSISVRGSAPVNTVAPHIGGTPARVGLPLRCEAGTWTGLPEPSYAYHWVRDEGEIDEVTVASTREFVPGLEDVGQSLVCVVTATNSAGSVTVASAPVVVPAGGGVAPHNVVAPVITGIPALGAEVDCSPGEWSGNPAPTLHFKWFRKEGAGSALIAGAITDAYVVSESELGYSIDCEVTATNSEGAASQSSEPLAIPGLPPNNRELPLVSGTPSVGERLTCLLGAWDGKPAPKFTYAWLRNGTAIPFASAQTYTLTSEDRGTSISCSVTARNVAGEARAASGNEVTIEGLAPEVVELPQVLGTPTVSETLKCAPGAWNAAPPPSFTYQWLLGGAKIPAATTNALTLTNAERGQVVACEVTAENRLGEANASSGGLHIPGVAPDNVEAPSITGTPAVGQPLTCMRGSWNGQPPPVFAVQWLRDGVALPSAKSATYSVERADEAHALSCRVTATNVEGKGEAESAALTVKPLSKAGAPEFSVPPPTHASQILAALELQIGRASHRARIAALRRSGGFSFPFAASYPGRLVIYWYQASAGQQASGSHSPIALASASTTYASAGPKTVKLRLTGAGRTLFARSRQVTLAIKILFIPSQGSRVTWLTTFLLNH
jgi:hypothetical protein